MLGSHLLSEMLKRGRNVGVGRVYVKGVCVCVCVFVCVCVCVCVWIVGIDNWSTGIGVHAEKVAVITKIKTG